MTETPAIVQVPAIVLCGGLSARMGKDKANLEFGVQSMLHAVENIFAQRCRRVVIVAGNDQANIRPADSSSELIRDAVPGLGPLEGLRVGLEHCSTIADVTMVATCDSPLINLEVYELMLQQLRPGDQAVIPVIGDRPYPLTAVYRSSSVSIVAQMIEQRDLKVRNLMKRIPFCRLDSSELTAIDPDLFTFENINTPQEYRAALKAAGLPVPEGF